MQESQQVGQRNRESRNNTLPKIWQLSTTLRSHSFQGSGVQAQVSWILCSGSHQAEIKRDSEITRCEPRLGSHLRLRVLFQAHRLLVGLTGGGRTGSLFSGWLAVGRGSCSAPGGCPQILVLRPSHNTVACFFKAVGRISL